MMIKLKKITNHKLGLKKYNWKQIKILLKSYKQK